MKPGETLEMPVVFYVDPDIVDVPELKDLKTITLSYTFFPIEGEKPVARAPKADGGKVSSKLYRGLTWLTHTRNITTITSSTRAPGRSLGQSVRLLRRSAASPGCST